MHFVYEKYDSNLDMSLNFINCPDVNNSGISRFTTSPIVSTIIRTAKMARGCTCSQEPPLDKKYIIPTGVAHSPIDWCGPDSQNVGFDKAHPEKKSLFAHLNETYLGDLQRYHAYLLIDQSHEGYQTEWMWEWFHNNCNDYKIDPGQIIYVTGNLESAEQYKAWADSHRLLNRIYVVPYAHFEGMIYESAINQNRNLLNKFFNKTELPNYSKQFKFKKANLSKIKVYNALQKRPRAHRAWFFSALCKAGLIEYGINSMNAVKKNETYFEDKRMSTDDFEQISKLLPIMPPENPTDYKLDNFASGDSGNYLSQFNEETMLSSWVTVVSEASVGDSEGQCFISEKTFKPIACHHPFIIYGNRYSLKHLREMGYKTFSPFIDESYDELCTWQRLDAIIAELTRIKNIPEEEKLSWFKGMKDILEYNYKIFEANTKGGIPKPMDAILEYVDRK